MNQSNFLILLVSLAMVACGGSDQPSAQSAAVAPADDQVVITEPAEIVVDEVDADAMPAEVVEESGAEEAVDVEVAAVEEPKA